MKEVKDLCDKCEHQVVCQKNIENTYSLMLYYLGEGFKRLGIKKTLLLITECGNFREINSESEWKIGKVNKAK